MRSAVEIEHHSNGVYQGSNSAPNEDWHSTHHLDMEVSSILESTRWDSNVGGSNFGPLNTLHGHCIHLTNESTHHAPPASDCDA